MPRSSDLPKSDGDGAEGHTNRNFALPPDQVEWLRDTAYHQKTTQAKLVREGLEDLMGKYAKGKGRYQ